MLFHVLGCIFCFSTSVALSVFFAHASILMPSDDYNQRIVDNYLLHANHLSSFAPMQACMKYFDHDNYVWSIIGLVFLLISFVCHVVIISFIDITWVRASFRSVIQNAFSAMQGIPSVVTKDESEKKAPNPRLRIPSTRKYPSSPIILNPMSLEGPMLETKKPHAP